VACYTLILNDHADGLGLFFTLAASVNSHEGSAKGISNLQIFACDGGKGSWGARDPLPPPNPLFVIHVLCLLSDQTITGGKNDLNSGEKPRFGTV